MTGNLLCAPEFCEQIFLSVKEEKSASIDKHDTDEIKNRLSFEERRKQHRQQWNMNQYPPIRSTRKLVRKLYIVVNIGP